MSLASRITRAPVIPRIVQEQFRKAPPPDNCYEELFREVVARAVFDAVGDTGTTDMPEHKSAVRAARMWFKFNHDDQRYIFELANMPIGSIPKDVLAIPFEYELSD